MIYFIEGRDDEINSSLEDLRDVVSRRIGTTKAVSLKTNDISGTYGYVVAEISDVQSCIESGIEPGRIIGIGYSRSSYYGKPTTEGLHRHYTTSRAYHPTAIELPFGYSPTSSVKEIGIPKKIGIYNDFIPPHLKDLESYEYVYEPCTDDKYDILVYAVNDDRHARSIRHAVASGIPIIGYTSVPLIAELVNNELAFELDESDNFENAITNTISYIGANVQWQLANSVDLFKYASDNMNWDRWIYELERL